MSGSAKAALAVSSRPSRRSTTPRLDGPMMRMPVSAATSFSRCFARDAVRAGLGEPGGQHGGDLHAGPAAFGDRVDHGLGRHQHVGVLRHLGQRRDRRLGALAQHRLAPCGLTGRSVPPIARLAQEIAAAGRRSSPASFDCPTITTERGDSSAWRSSARAFGVIGIFRKAKRQGPCSTPPGDLRKFAAAPKPGPGRPVARHRSSQQRANWRNSNLTLRCLFFQRGRSGGPPRG